MFKISDFAVMAQIPASQLRYYDEIDLFKPHSTDSQNGYRYYAIEQLADLNRILALKSLGLSLDEIQQTLNSHVSTNDIGHMLEAKREEIKQRIAEDQTRLAQVEARLQLLECGHTPTTQAVVVKPVYQQTYLAFECISPDRESFINQFSRAYNLIHTANPEGRKYTVCIAHNSDYQPDGLRWELGFYVTKEAPSTLQIEPKLCLKRYDLPPVENMASIIHVGSLQTGGLTYTALGQWINFNQYEIIGAFREIFLVQDAPLDTMNSMVMEIQVPIKIN